MLCDWLPLRRWWSVAEKVERVRRLYQVRWMLAELAPPHATDAASPVAHP
jgi:hypothetical protein